MSEAHHTIQRDKLIYTGNDGQALLISYDGVKANAFMDDSYAIKQAQAE